jgi:CubicO group peptidase (beta-lactamase class C family)
VILQLQDEGKLDVERPIAGYLPWLPVDTAYGEILIHHLLTHSSGMPSDAEVFPDDTGGRVRQSFQPGSQFHYCNWGYAVLGLLIESLDGVPWGESVHRRILQPLGMSDTAPVIGSDDRARIVPSYVPLHDDRPYPRHGPLAPAGILTFAHASGSIASTPVDMGRYMAALLRGGIGPHGRIVSAAGFHLLSTAHIPAEEFGPGASYGYGIAVDTLDGHRRLRHTGGMVSFMSAMHLDLDAGVGAFASINAMLGYRPNPVAEYAIRLLRAAREHTAAPAPPPADSAAVIERPADYAGTFRAPDGRMLEITVTEGRLLLVVDGVSIPLQQDKPDRFIADHPRFALFPIVFGRDPLPEPRDQVAGPVVELAHGPDWYAHGRYSGPADAPLAPELAPYAGLYCSNDPWIGNFRVVVRRGRLWVDGDQLLAGIGEHVFRIADEPSSPETAEFRHIVAGRAQVLLIGGGICRRAPG